MENKVILESVLVAPSSSVTTLGNVKNDVKMEVVTADPDNAECMSATLIAPAKSVHDLHGVQPQGVADIKVVTCGIPFPVGAVAPPESVTPLGNLKHDEAIDIELVSEGESFDIVAPQGSITRLGSIDDGRVRIGPLMMGHYRWVIGSYYCDNDGYYLLPNNSNELIRFTNFIVRIDSECDEINIDGDITKSIEFTVINGRKETHGTTETRNFKKLGDFIEREYPRCTIFTDMVKNGKDRLKHIFSQLLNDTDCPQKTFYSYFGWGRQEENGSRMFLHGGLDNCTSDKVIPPADGMTPQLIPDVLHIFDVADKEIIYPLFFYQAAAFMDALFTDANYPLQHSVMAIAKTGSYKTHLFKVLFDPFRPAHEKVASVRSTAASLKVLHQQAFDDVLIVDDFNTEGSKSATEAKKHRIWDLIRAYSDKSPARTWAGRNKTKAYALRGGCVFTAEEELTGEIESEGVRYIKVIFSHKPDGKVLNYFQAHPELMSLFWSGFIAFLEKNYIPLVKKIREGFITMRDQYEHFHFDRLRDSCIHTMLAAKAVSAYLLTFGCLSSDDCEAMVKDVETVILAMLRRQDKGNKKLSPEVQYVIAIFDNISFGKLLVAANAEQYASCPSRFAGYHEGNLIMLDKVTAYESVVDYYRRKGEYFGTGEPQMRKVLKKADVTECDSNCCLKKASIRASKNRPRMLAIKKEMAYLLIQKEED